MSEQVTIEVTDCRDCPYRYDNRSHGECWAECSHPEAPGGFKNILWGCQEHFEKVPGWCPIFSKGEG